ncbi:MAG: hypothetical protein JXO72_13325, partial [Vicinamibacteria bacterium]|nr:hypothetical protein [Vicinamibacteria bacterium]
MIVFTALFLFRELEKVVAYLPMRRSERMKKTMAVVVMLFLACFVIEATVDAGEDCKKGEKVVAQNVDSAQPVTDAATDESTAAPAKA